MPEESNLRAVAVNRGAKHADSQAAKRGPRHDALEAWMGRWINEGYLINDEGTTYRPSMRVTLTKVDPVSGNAVN